MPRRASGKPESGRTRIEGAERNALSNGKKAPLEGNPASELPSFADIRAWIPRADENPDEVLELAREICRDRGISTVYEFSDCVELRGLVAALGCKVVGQTSLLNILFPEEEEPITRPRYNAPPEAEPDDISLHLEVPPPMDESPEFREVPRQDAEQEGSPIFLDATPPEADQESSFLPSEFLMDDESTTQTRVGPPPQPRGSPVLKPVELSEEEQELIHKTIELEQFIDELENGMPGKGTWEKFELGKRMFQREIEQLLKRFDKEEGRRIQESAKAKKDEDRTPAERYFARLLLLQELVTGLSNLGKDELKSRHVGEISEVKRKEESEKEEPKKEEPAKEKPEHGLLRKMLASSMTWAVVSIAGFSATMHLTDTFQAVVKGFRKAWEGIPILQSIRIPEHPEYHLDKVVWYGAIAVVLVATEWIRRRAVRKEEERIEGFVPDRMNQNGKNGEQKGVDDG